MEELGFSPFFSLYWFFVFNTNDPSLNSIPIAKLQRTKHRCECEVTDLDTGTNSLCELTPDSWSTLTRAPTSPSSHSPEQNCRRRRSLHLRRQKTNTHYHEFWLIVKGKFRLKCTRCVLRRGHLSH